MTTAMPVLSTPRLLVRPLRLDDLAAVHQLLDVDLAEADFGTEGNQSLAEREDWLRWTVLNYEQLAKLYQPPYGERAIVLRGSGQLVGLVGFVQSIGPWEQLPGLAQGSPQPNQRFTPAFGMYWAVAPAHQKQGYASEAARAMLDYAFQVLNLKRVVATTSYDNAASQAVMRRLGMRLERNAFPDPPWFQVVGVADYRPSAQNEH
jgi:[ribosomal protein S5]-alanine N-acetyltransferase